MNTDLFPMKKRTWFRRRMHAIGRHFFIKKVRARKGDAARQQCHVGGTFPGAAPQDTDATPDPPADKENRIGFDVEHDEICQTAYHEAGHVVAHLEFGHAIEYVTIEPGPEGTPGYVKRGPLGVGSNLEMLDLDDPPEVQRERAGITQGDLDQILVTLLSGEMATYVLTGALDHVGSRRRSRKGGDVRNVGILVLRLFSSWENDPEDPGRRAANAYIKEIWEQTEQFVRRKWPQVEAIAHELLEHGTLTVDQCREVARDQLDS